MWIEIEFIKHATIRTSVTPLAGVWIEIHCVKYDVSCTGVTPLAGVWIEIYLNWAENLKEACHSPCGSVD